MFLLLSKPKRLAFSTLLGELSAKRDAQELPGRVKASSNYLRKVSFLSLLHQSGLSCASASPHCFPTLLRAMISQVQSSLPPRGPCLLSWWPVLTSPCSQQLPHWPWYRGHAQHGAAAVPVSPSQAVTTCPKIPPASPAPAALPPLDLSASSAVAMAILRGTAAFCDSLQLFYGAQSKQNETVIKIYEIIVPQKPTEKEKWQ